jgi:protease I
MIKKFLEFVETKSEKSVAILTDNGFQDSEVIQPKEELKKYVVHIISPSSGELKAFNSNKKVAVDKTLNEISHKDYDLLIIPGGKAPDKLRKNNEVIEFVRKFYRSGKTIASICHGPLILVSADLVKNKNMTCYEDAVEELKGAGANYVNKSCVEDGQFITSRNPKDLDNFCNAIINKLK